MKVPVVYQVNGGAVRDAVCTYYIIGIISYTEAITVLFQCTVTPSASVQE